MLCLSKCSPDCHPDVVAETREMEGMVEAAGRYLCCLRPAQYDGDSGNLVSRLGAHPFEFPCSRQFSVGKSSTSNRLLPFPSSISGVLRFGRSSASWRFQTNDHSQQPQGMQPTIYALIRCSSPCPGRRCRRVKVPAFSSSALTVLRVSPTSIRRA